MNEFKGTPGPWKADYWLDGEPSVMFDGPALTRVCRMEYIVKAGAVPNDEMEANADLIAEATNLLEALVEAEEVFRILADEGPSSTARELADKYAAIIAKALGK